MVPLTYKIATREIEFEAIHRLNYDTFVEEIPQHTANPARILIDRFHAQNTYVICLDGPRMAGMICGRCARPFSMDEKVANLDRYLPVHRKAVEIRLLAIAQAYRKTTAFAGLIAFLYGHFRAQGCDLALISATVRELKLYRHLGFQAFADPVGSPGALYQPMYVTLKALDRARSLKGP